MKKIPFTLIIFLFVNIAFGQTKVVPVSKGKYLPGVYKTLNYDKVVIYEHFSSDWQEVISKGKICDSLITKTHILTKQLQDSLHQIIFNTTTYGTAPSEFSKVKSNQYVIVYYLKNKIVSHMSIHFSANYIVPTLEIPACSFTRIKDRNSGYLINAEGFSSSGKQELQGFLRSLK